ncbi:hypothetical protein AALO_G00158570 [Alosa alosa]|uniref:Uncharacterized protein n=1 Tax=Alosa alosa TaxID=278164 RepID=A0AAV6GK74_9TELE|nr:hypothetical protein AALO_G00158570 [Alosa alosa]
MGWHDVNVKLLSSWLSSPLASPDLLCPQESQQAGKDKMMARGSQFHFLPCVQVLDMNQKMEDILKILVEHFKPKPELLQKPAHHSSRVTVMKHMGVSMDEGH